MVNKNNVYEEVGKDIIIQSNLDNSREQRIVIIYSDVLCDQCNRDGEMDIISSPRGVLYYHYIYFQKYASKYYLNDLHYQNLVQPSDSNYGISSFIFLLVVQCHDIVFMDTTDEASKGKYGVLYLPNEISKYEYEAFMKFLPYLKKFHEILVIGELYFCNQQLENRISDIICGKDIEQINKYLNCKVKSHSKKGLVL